MKILQVHNAYQQKGGEDTVVQAEYDLLKDRHEIKQYIVSNRSISGFPQKIKAAWNIAYKKDHDLENVINKFNPDIVHIHNFFPLITPAVYDICGKAKTIQTLHNYRTICANGLFLRNGQICEDCLGSSPYQAVLNKCYRNSYIGSFSLARMIQSHKKSIHKVDKFISLTEFAKNKFIQAGFPNGKIAVKPNFTEKPSIYDKINLAVFVGLLSHEKGVDVLIEAWERIRYPLAIIGDGPLLDSFVSPNVHFAGFKDREEVHKIMGKAKFLVMPSILYEGFPMVIVEAFSNGLPVICSRLGGMAEIVEDGITGLHFEPGNANDLTSKIQWLIDHPDECKKMGDNAMRLYEEKYTPEINYQLLIDIYNT